MSNPVLEPRTRTWVPEDKAHARDGVKPLLRGHLHQWTALSGIAVAVVLVVLSPGGLPRLGSAIWGVGTLLMFGTSALYHRITWAPKARTVMKRMDHAMIFVFIAGTYTPYCLTVLHGTERLVVLLVIWLGAMAGITVRMAWLGAPRGVTISLYIALGWVAVFVLPSILHGAGVAALVLLMVGGVLYSGGAVVYALRRPDPFPAVFGYHEIFHACTVLAYVCHAVSIYLAVLSAG